MEKEVEEGQLIAGKYRVERVLGRGGMGVVMAALHEHLNQRVALKFLTDNAYQQPEAVGRFVREARAAVQIQSEHVARVMDVGTLDSGAPYMVMEYLKGRDLKDVSTRRGPLPVSEAVDYVLQACDAVAEAHSLGIIHRDLKPSNLFLTERPDGSPLVKVLDFGISKALNAGDTSQLQMTATAAIMGSPQYMSPEQIRSSKNVDARADVWALGTILHELLTGSPAYVADTVPGLLAMIVADSPPPLRSARPDAPADLEAAILRCLQKDRERRFASVSEFARSLERFASSETRPLIRRIARVLGDDSPPPTEIAPASAAGATVREPSVGTTNGTWARTGQLDAVAAAPPPYRRPAVQLGVGAGAVGILAVAWLAFTGPSTEDDISLETEPAQRTVAPAASPVREVTPAAIVPPTGVAPPAPAASATALPAPPAIGIVRPVPKDSALELAEAEAKKVKPAAPEEPEEEQATRAGSRTKKPAASSRPPKASRSTSPKPSATRPRAENEGAAPPPPPPKKTNTLEDLFGDTK